MLFAHDLNVYVLIVVLVKYRDRLGVAYPQVDSIRVLLQGYPGKWDVSLDIGEQGNVFIAEVVIFLR